MLIDVGRALVRVGLIGLSCLLVVLLAACATPRAISEDTATPAAVPFRSDRYHLEASLPPGWAAAEGPERLARPFTGLVAFNSWGEASFWAPEVRTGSGASYDPQSTLGQVRDGEAYVVLVNFSGGPVVLPEEVGPEYERVDLGGLWEPGDCRQAGGTTWTDFEKWGRRLRLEVYCQPDASGATATAVNELLASWHFDRVPAGDPAWATLLARSSLPPAAAPEKFALLTGWPVGDEPLQTSVGESDATRITRAEVRGETVEVTFMIRWGDPALGWSGEECPADRCRWWRFEVGPDGGLVVIDEDGAPLLSFSMQGPWLRHSDAVLGFVAEVPGDWQVTAPVQQLDALGRSWTAMELVSPDYVLTYPPLDQFHFGIAVAEGVAGTLTDTVELSLKALAPGFRAHVQVQCCLTVGGEPAMELQDYPPTRWGNRQLVILHGGREYRLTFYPLAGLSAESEAGTAARSVLDAFLRTFAFIPVTVTPLPPTPPPTPAPTPTAVTDTREQAARQ